MSKKATVVQPTKLGGDLALLLTRLAAKSQCRELPRGLPSSRRTEGIVMVVKNAKASKQGAYELALKAASRKRPDLIQANAFLEEAHAQGDRRATYALATWSLFGNVVRPKDLQRAVQLLKLAAKADLAAAHFDLAVSYETGQGAKKNEKAAYRHFLAAAVNGDNDSLVEVGRCLYYGIGVARDRKTAEVWFRRADALGLDVR